MSVVFAAIITDIILSNVEFDLNKLMNLIDFCQLNQ